MTDDLVKAAREVLMGVTEGPWHVTECGDYWVEHKQPLANADGFRGVALCGDMIWPNADTLQCEWEANARFIAAARSLVPALADRIEALEADNARLQADLTEARRRRDQWMAKAEGFEVIRKALREKVGAPWPPHLSRLLWAGIAADEKARADEAEAEVARLKAASVITGPGEAALREAIAFVEGTIGHTLASRAGDSRAFTIIKGLNAILNNPGKEVMPDVSGTVQHFSSHDAAPASLSAGGGAEIGETPNAVLTSPSSAHVAGLREAAKIVQERRDVRYKDAHAWWALDEVADAILARAAELEAPDADV